MLIVWREFETVHHQSTGSIRLCYVNQVSSYFNLIQSPPSCTCNPPFSHLLSLSLLFSQRENYTVSSGTKCFWQPGLTNSSNHCLLLRHDQTFTALHLISEADIKWPSTFCFKLWNNKCLLAENKNHIMQFSNSTQGLFTTVDHRCIIKALMNNHAFKSATFSFRTENKSSDCSYHGQGLN